MRRRCKLLVGLVCSIPVSACLAAEQSCFMVNEVVVQSDGLAKPDIEKLTQQLPQRVCSGNEISQRVVFALENLGYFRARADQPRIQSPTDHAESGANVSLRVHEGARYHVTDLQVVGSTAFSSLRLQNLFPVSAGDWYGRNSISMGLNSLLHLYSQAGYRNAAVVPQFKIDDASHAIEAYIDVDEGEHTSAAQETSHTE
jgi:outer membrane protein assembly factor BamA